MIQIMTSLWLIFLVLYLNDNCKCFGGNFEYPSLSATCQSIALSTDSDWIKVNRWKVVLNNMNLDEIHYTGNNEVNIEESVMNAMNSKVHEFSFNGEKNQGCKLQGRGKLTLILLS